MSLLTLAQIFLGSSSAWNIDSPRLLIVGILLIPEAISVSGIFLYTSILARTPKEAMAWNTPVQLGLIMCSAAPVLLGPDLSDASQYIPILNVCCLFSNIITGSLDLQVFLMALVTNIAFAVICVILCVRQFNRESVMYRY
jgi:sodium transport system permease protein